MSFLDVTTYVTINQSYTSILYKIICFGNNICGMQEHCYQTPITSTQFVPLGTKLRRDITRVHTSNKLSPLTQALALLGLVKNMCVIDMHCNFLLYFKNFMYTCICILCISIFLYQGKDVSSLLSINSRKEIFYESRISFEYTNKQRSCIETVKVSCRVGQTSFKVVDFVNQCRQSGEYG